MFTYEVLSFSFTEFEPLCMFCVPTLATHVTAVSDLHTPHVCNTVMGTGQYDPKPIWPPWDTASLTSNCNMSFIFKKGFYLREMTAE